MQKITAWLARIGHPVYLALITVGDFVHFCREVLFWAVHPPFRLRRFMDELNSVGVRSLGIVTLVGLFAGMVFGLQIGSAFKLFNAETLTGATVGLALTRELAPVFTAMMMVSRAGSAMSAEIGTMQVTEQVDALQCMAVNPLQYLVVPKVLAATLMAPLLTGIFNGIGMLGSYVVSIYLIRIPEGSYLERFKYMVDPTDLYQGIIKAFIFGFIFSLIACYYGYRTRGGAEGVGRATTKAVVMASVIVLISDYFLATWLLKVFPDY